MKKIIICLPGKSVSTNFLINWTRLLSSVPAGVVFGLRTVYDSNVYYVRQKCLGYDLSKGDNQLPFGGEEYDYILWIDTDIVFKPEDVYRLIEDCDNGMDIVSGVYSCGVASNETGQTVYSAVLKMNDEYILKYGDYERIDGSKIGILTDDGKKPIIGVSYCGMGFMIVKKGVFEKMGCLPFEPVRINIKNGDGVVKGFSAEDTAFCIKAQDVGFKVFVDTRVVLGHEKLTII